MVKFFVTFFKTRAWWQNLGLFLVTLISIFCHQILQLAAPMWIIAFLTFASQYQNYKKDENLDSEN